MKTKFKTVCPREEVITKFPCIGILKDEDKSKDGNELAVLFTSPEVGQVIHNVGTKWVFGHSSDQWAMECFRPMRTGEEIIIKG